MSFHEQEVALEDIDALNLQCYESLAEEYDDPAHETCRDFDAGTECFLKKALKMNVFPRGLHYLDVGVGTGKTLEFIMPWLEEMEARIEVLDISPAMIGITRKKFGKKIKAYHTASIHDFKPAIKYDLIIAALCDPFLTKKSIEVYKQSLSEDGVLMMTLPTNTWARKVRKNDIQQTIFHDKQRNKYASYSFCWSKGDLIKFVESVGFVNHYCKVIFVDDIQRTKQRIGKINQGLAAEEKRMSMLLTLIFLNKK